MAISWGEVYPPTGTAADKDWIICAISKTGQYMIAGINGGTNNLWRSNNYGAAGSWSLTKPAGSATFNVLGLHCGISDDGQVILIGGYAGRLWLSTAGGGDGTWSEMNPTGTTANRAWRTVRVSGNGQILLCAYETIQPYISTNQGANWTALGNAVLYDCLDLSDGGQTLLVGASPIHYSLNGGTSFSHGPTGASWVDGKVSFDGTKMVICFGGTGGRVQLTTNSGTTWTDKQANGNTNDIWAVVSGNYDLGVIIAAISAKRIRLSIDGGTSWNETTPTGSGEDKDWRLLHTNYYGNYYLAGVHGGRLYVGHDTAFDPVVSEPFDFYSDGKAIVSNTFDFSGDGKGIISNLFDFYGDASARISNLFDFSADGKGWVSNILQFFADVKGIITGVGPVVPLQIIEVECYHTEEIAVTCQSAATEIVVSSEEFPKELTLESKAT